MHHMIDLSVLDLAPIAEGSTAAQAATAPLYTWQVTNVVEAATVKLPEFPTVDHPVCIRS